VIYKIYRKGNYIVFEWQTFKKQHVVDELEFDKTSTQFIIKNKFNNKVNYNFDFLNAIKENSFPYTEVELTTFLNDNTAGITSSGGGGAGDASSSNQVTGNNFLQSIDIKTATAAKQDLAKIALDLLHADLIAPIPTGNNAIGQVTANAGTNLNTSALNLEATQLLIKGKTDNIDVALSTRLKPSDTLAAVTTLGTITNALPVGNNIIGKFTTDQTTHGVTDLVASDITKIKGVAISTNSGINDVATQRYTLATDDFLNQNIGAKTDIEATTNIGTFSLISLTKRLLNTVLAFGQKTMLNSISTTISSDQSDIYPNRTITNAGFQIITDGTNSATVKASLGQTSRTDKSLVVSLKANQTTNVHTASTVGLTSQVAISANLERKGFELQNNSTADIIIGIGITPTLTSGFVLTAKSMYSTPAMMSSTAVVNIIGTTIGQQYTYIEY
jgi:hypothetical protein